VSEYVLKNYVEHDSYRLIPSKYPPISLYEDVASPEQLEAIFAIEALTNPRLLEETGNFSRIPADERLVGIPHCSYVMAAFTYCSPDGGRFNTQDFGAYYCATSVDTAIKETVYHMELMLGYTDEPPQDVQMRSIAAVFSADLVDITGEKYLSSNIYHPTNYAPGQAMAATLKASKQDGIRYRSVRHGSNECFALFKPNLVTKVCQAKHYSYKWNGAAINNIIELQLV